MKKKITSVCFTGHRPDKLYGYRSYENWKPLFDTLCSLCEKMYDEYGTRTFVTGGAQGVDQTAFWAVHRLAQKHEDVNNVVYVPMPGQESRWREDGPFGQKDYQHMLDMASSHVVISDTPSKKAFLVRNHRMVDDTEAVIAVWNTGPCSGASACVRYAGRQGRPVIAIDPFFLSVGIPPELL